MDETLRLDSAHLALRSRRVDTGSFFAEGDHASDEATATREAEPSDLRRRLTTRLVLLHRRVRTLRWMAAAFVASLAVLAIVARVRPLGYERDGRVAVAAAPPAMPAPAAPPPAFTADPAPPVTVAVAAATPTGTDRAVRGRPGARPKPRARTASGKAPSMDTGGVPGEREF